MTNTNTNNGFTEAEAVTLYDGLFERLAALSDFGTELEHIIDSHVWSPATERRLVALKDAVAKAEEAGERAFSDVADIAEPFVKHRRAKPLSGEEAKAAVLGSPKVQEAFEIGQGVLVTLAGALRFPGGGRCRPSLSWRHAVDELEGIA